MKRLLLIPVALAVAALFSFGPAAHTDDSFSKVAEEVNLKLVKLFGSGGIRGLASYGTGVIIDREGHILTVNSHILETRDLRMHMADGTRYQGKVIAREPALDIALIKVNSGQRKPDIEGYFDVAEAARKPIAEPGTHILAFSNQFQIATRDEPMSIQRGVIAAYSKLFGRIGVFEASYRGNVYVIDAITNNPGAGGGVITNRKGELLALIGKELRNELTSTWINYAIPLNATVEVPDEKGKKVTTSILKVIELKDKYRPVKIAEAVTNVAFSGIVLVPNVVDRTPPYVEEVIPGSPADVAKLKPDDLIVYVDGLPVQDINTFEKIMAGYTPETEVKLEIQRGDKLNTVSIKLAKPPKAPETKK